MWNERQMSERVSGCAFAIIVCGILAMVVGWLGLVMGGLLVVVER